MGNMYLPQEIYNEDLKNEFLKTYESKKTNKKTMVTYRYQFQISYKTESQLGKDIWDFNDAELMSLLRSYRNGSVEAVRTTRSVLSRYLDFCVSKGYIRVNLLQDISGFEDDVKYVNKNVQQQKHINREEFEKMIAECINYQDALPIAMAYYGFMGEKYCEITNLQIKHVNKTENKIYIENRNETFIIDDFLMDLIIKTMNEEFYTKLLSDESIVLRSAETKIYKNDYVLRTAGKDINEPVRSINIIGRLNRVKSYAGNPYLTVKSIWNSGMLDRFKSIYKEKGSVEKEDWIEIGDLYGYSPVYWTKTKQRLGHMLEDNEEN